MIHFDKTMDRGAVVPSTVSSSELNHVSNADNDILIVFDETVDELLLERIKYVRETYVYLQILIGLDQAYIWKLGDLLQANDTTVKSGNAIFFMKIKTDVTERLKSRWLDLLKRNNPGVDIKYFAVYVVNTIGDLVRILAPELANEVAVLGSLDYVFHWWPYLLRHIYGTNGPIGKKPTIVDIAVDTERSNLLIFELKKMFKKLGFNDDMEPSEDHILLICDRLGSENKKKYRSAKLNGQFIHALSTSDNRELLTELQWISSRQSNSNVIMIFVGHLMLDMKLVKLQSIWDMIVTIKCPTYPLSSPINMKSASPTAITLRWKKHEGDPSLLRFVIKQRSGTNENWTTIEEGLDGSTTKYTARGLQLNERYQFNITVESVDADSEPTYSQWFRLQDDNKTKQVLVNIALVPVLILVVILDILQSILVVAATVLMTLGTILLALIFLALAIYTLCNERLLKKLEIENSLQAMWKHFKYSHLILYCVFLFGSILSGIIVSTTSAVSGLTAVQTYISFALMTLFTLLWSIIANVVCYKYFDCRKGVFSLPRKIWDIIKSDRFKTRIVPVSGNDDCDVVDLG